VTSYIKHIFYNINDMNIKTTLVIIAAFAVVAALATPLLTNAAYALHKAGHEPQDDNPNSAKGTFPHGPFQACNRGATTNPSPNLPAQCQ
jgi:hypothetical protein